MNSKGDVKSRLQPALCFRLPGGTAEGKSRDFFLSVLGTIWPQPLVHKNSRAGIFNHFPPHGTHKLNTKILWHTKKKFFLLI